MYDEKLEVEDMETVREHMRARLEQMRRSGVALFVDGQEALPDEVVSKAVQENSPYMADYAGNRTAGSAVCCCRLGLPLMLTAAALPHIGGTRIWIIAEIITNLLMT